MQRHDANIGLISCTVLVFAIGFGGASFGLADEPAGQPASSPTVQEEKATPADSGEVQERAVTRDQQKNRTTSPTLSAPAPGTGPLPIVGGTFEPDYRYPWVVQISGCKGVLLDPRWVLTAAHCITDRNLREIVTYSRTDPYTGAVNTQSRDANPPGGGGSVRAFIHPMYDPKNYYAYDIALIELTYPFMINSYLQTVGLPRSPRQQGVVGTVASFNSTPPPPPGQIAIFRAPIPLVDYPPKFTIAASDAAASLCQGDSGSGFVTVENGRATVRGIASQASITACPTLSGSTDFTDVFTVHDWILQTMGKSDASLVGNTRVRWSGTAARGAMSVACQPSGTLQGPLNVVGVEEGAVCQPGQSQVLSCALDQDQGNVGQVMPTRGGITMRTTMANGTSEVQSLAWNNNNVSYHTTYPPGAVSREFICQIGTLIMKAPLTGSTPLILQRGVEPESTPPSPTGQEEQAPAPK